MLQTKFVEKTHFIFYNFYIRPFCELMWENILEPGRPHVTI